MTAVQGTGSWWHARWHDAAWSGDGPAAGGTDPDTGARGSSGVGERVDSWEHTSGTSGTSGSSGTSGTSTAAGSERFDATVPGTPTPAPTLTADEITQPVTDAVSGILGITSDDLTTRLTAGETLNDVATSLGITHDDLVTLIKAALPDGLTDTQAGQLAENLTTTTWPPTDDQVQVDDNPGTPGPTRTLDLTLTHTATLLGTTPTDLTSQLGQGVSLDTLATAAGITHDDLVTAITTDLPTTPPTGWDPTTLAEHIATQTDPTPTPTDGGTSGGTSGGTGTTEGTEHHHGHEHWAARVRGRYDAFEPWGGHGRHQW